jgi:zinc protease
VSFVCAALGLGSLVSACAPPPGAGAPAFARAALPAELYGKKTRAAFSLPNGVSVILEENHLAPVVAVQAWIDAGSASEEAGQGGLAHLTERVVLGGARADDDAAPVTAWTSFDETVFESVVAAPFAARRLDALGALLARGAFDAAEVERARAGVLGELARAAASPEAVATNALFAAAFARHGYGRPVLGTEASLRGLGPADVAAFHARAYAGRRVTIVVVGDFDGSALRERVTAAFAALPKGELAHDAAASAFAPGKPATAVSTDAGEGRLAVGFRVAPSGGEGLAAIDVVAAALAYGAAGRLPRELVQNRQLARDVRTSVFHGREGALLVVDVALVAGRAEEALRVVLAETSRVRAELSSAELEAARAAVEADLARSQDTAAGTARRLGRFRRSLDDADDYRNSLGRLTLDEVGSDAEPLVATSKVFVAVAAPVRSPDALAARLGAVVASLAPKPRPVRATAVEGQGALVRAVLPSGVRVLVVREPLATSVVAHAVWSGGLRTEDARSNGATSLLAATLPRGTRTRDAARLAADLAAVGGTLTASAGRDELGVTATFLARRWDEGLALLADCLRHPALAEDEVERARRAALERVREREDDADVAAARLFAATLWPGHPYRLPLSGTAASLSGLARRRLADHFQRFYGAANLTIAVVGDVDAARVVETLRALFADAPAPLEPSAPAPPSPRATDAPTEVFAVAAQDRADVVVGYPGLPLADPDRRAAEVLVEMLGGREDARGGRLARELGGVSLVDASSWSGVDGGALLFELASTPASVDAAVAALRAALARVAAEPPPRAEVERARAALVGADARGLESRAAVAAALARDEALGLPAGSARRAGASLAAVTPEAVGRVARRLLDPHLEIVAVVRPPAAPAVAKAAPAKSTSTPGGRRPAAP